MIIILFKKNDESCAEAVAMLVVVQECDATEAS